VTARLRPQRQDHRLDVLMATPLHGYMGLHEVDPADPTRGLELTVDPKIANNSRMMHGGMVATALDVAAAYAIFPLLADDEVVLTNSLSISYLRPVPIGSSIWARAHVLRRGRATAFLRSEVGIGEKLVATAQVVKAIVTLEEE
jgi:uncharacterized protein (TIGR00369 family)